MDKNLIEENFTEKPQFYRVAINLNPNTDFLYRHVYGQNENFELHTHDYYELFLTLSGKIIHYVNNDMQILEPGCLVFIRPEDTHKYIYRNEKQYEFVNLTFSKKIGESLLSYLGGADDISAFTSSALPKTVRLTPAEVQSFMKRADKFNTVNSDDYVEQRLNIRSFLLDTFIKYFLRRKDEFRANLPQWLEITCDKMQKPENFIAGIPRMVKISGKTQEHLARTVRKHLDVSLSQYINDLRLNYAVNLIINTNLHVTDICFEAGFGNISCFYSLFNKTYGMSPVQFRKSKLRFDD